MILRQSSGLKIRPGILVQKIDDLFKQMSALKPYFKNIHIDIADNILVPNKTIEINDILSTIQQFRNLTIGLSFDFHLMVKDYESDIKKINKLKKFMKIENILIHASVLEDYEKLTIQYPFFSIGITLNTQDKVDTIRNMIDLSRVPIIQIMTVDAGFQGQSINMDSLNKVEQLRHAGYGNIITIDGGVNEQTIPIITALKYRPDRLDGVGSFFLKTKSIKERIEFLKKYGCY